MTASDIEEIASVLPDKMIDSILDKCQRNTFDEVSFLLMLVLTLQLQEAIKDLIDNGYSGTQFISQVIV